MNRLLLFLIALVSCMVALPVVADVPRPKPNIVFIFADDWGWGDLSCHGNTWLKTPNLDQLASEGIDFAQFNVLNPVCSPSRAALMTGLYPARFCIHQHFATPAQNHARNMPDWLDPQAVTLPRLLKQAGYRTGHFGKWHLTNRETHGSPKPEAYGYDEAAVFNGGAEWPSVDLHATAPNTAAFIKANKDKPFFINVWLHESHTPHVPTKESMEKWKHLDEQKQVYAAVITDGDDAVGLILDALKEAGVEDNTLVLFSSDNGPESTGTQKGFAAKDDHTGSQGYGTYYSIGDTGGLRGRKRSLFEGGVRVPFLVRWPNRVPAGTKNETTVLTAVDMLPTLCSAAGVTLPEGYASDGENLFDALSGEVVSRTRPIFWEWRGTVREPDWWPRLAVRDGDWKLAIANEPGRAELYRLSDDRGEARDMAAEHPEIVARLSAMAAAWVKTLPASPAEACIDRSGRARSPSRKQGVSARQGSGTSVVDAPAEAR
jgi:arylsulfatase A-like enzyme